VLFSVLAVRCGHSGVPFPAVSRFASVSAVSPYGAFAHVLEYRPVWGLSRGVCLWRPFAFRVLDPGLLPLPRHQWQRVCWEAHGAAGGRSPGRRSSQTPSPCPPASPTACQSCHIELAFSLKVMQRAFRSPPRGYAKAFPEAPLRAPKGLTNTVFFRAQRAKGRITQRGFRRSFRRVAGGRQRPLRGPPRRRVGSLAGHFGRRVQSGCGRVAAECSFGWTLVGMRLARSGYEKLRLAAAPPHATA
jgi:hypothetical protein